MLAPIVAYAAGKKDDRKVVIPFDFVSKFDDGRYGQMMGDMLWKKLSRQGGFILPESMLDVREFPPAITFSRRWRRTWRKCKRSCRTISAQIAIWGNLERAPGAEGESYDLSIKCVDFSVRPTPKVIYEVKARTDSVSEIPHLYVKQMFHALYEREPAAAAGPTRWPKKTGRTAPTSSPAISSTAAAACRRAGRRSPDNSANRSAGWSAGWPNKAIRPTKSFASRSTRTSPRTKA